jgi:hypothetical protein
MNSTFQNSGQVLSIGIFFTLMIIGLSSTLPASVLHGLTSVGVPLVDARRIAALPPVSTLFASFLGYNPLVHLLSPHVLATLPAHTQHALARRSFFPSIITRPFRAGLHAACDSAVLACLLAAGCSWLRGGKYVYAEASSAPPELLAMAD